MHDVVSIAPMPKDTPADWRPKLAWICDALIPKDERGIMPSANELNISVKLLPQALKARPDFGSVISRIMTTLPIDAPVEPLQTLRHLLAPADFAILARTMTSAYFLDVETNRRLGYPGQVALDYDPDFDEIMELVGRVIARGDIYIHTPQTSET